MSNNRFHDCAASEPAESFQHGQASIVHGSWCRVNPNLPGISTPIDNCGAAKGYFLILGILESGEEPSQLFSLLRNGV